MGTIEIGREHDVEHVLADRRAQDVAELLRSVGRGMRSRAIAAGLRADLAVEIFQHVEGGAVLLHEPTGIERERAVVLAPDMIVSPRFRRRPIHRVVPHLHDFVRLQDLGEVVHREHEAAIRDLVR